VARRPRRKRSPAGRLEDLLDRVSGKGSRERGDRKESNRSGIRVLDIPRNRELFERLVRSDYDYLMRQRFAVGHRNLTDLLPQSVLGRAQNGHGWFTDEWGTCLQFPDATFDRVLTVLEASAPHARGDLVRKRRGDMLRIFSDWILDNLWTPELELVLADGPVFGVELFAGRNDFRRLFHTVNLEKMRAQTDEFGQRLGKVQAQVDSIESTLSQRKMLGGLVVLLLLVAGGVAMLIRKSYHDEE